MVLLEGRKSTKDVIIEMKGGLLIDTKIGERALFNFIFLLFIFCVGKCFSWPVTADNGSICWGELHSL